MAVNKKAPQIPRRYEDAGHMLRSIRKRRGHTQKYVLNAIKKSYGKDVFSDETELSSIEAGKRRVKPRDALICLLARVYGQERKSVFDYVLDKSGYDKLSRKRNEIDECSLKDESAPSRPTSVETGTILWPAIKHGYASLSRHSRHSTQPRAGSLLPICGKCQRSKREGNHGVVHGGVTFVREGTMQAARLDGTTGYISVPDSPGLRVSRFTLTAWVTADAFKERQRIIEKGSSNSYWLILQSSRPLVGFRDHRHFVDLRSSIRLQPRRWHFLAATFDHIFLMLYIDDDTAPSMKLPAPTSPVHNSEPLIIGWKRNGIESDHFVGAMREVRIYNRALSAQEVYALYLAQSPTQKDNQILKIPAFLPQAGRAPSSTFDSSVLRGSA